MEISHGDYLRFRGFDLLVIGHNQRGGIRCLPFYWNGTKLPKKKRDPANYPELSDRTRVDENFRHKYVFLEESETAEVLMPEECLERLLSKRKPNKAEQTAIDLTNFFMDEAGVGRGEMGICGSVQLGKEKVGDIDFGVFGYEASRRAMDSVRSSSRFDFPLSKLCSKKTYMDPLIPVTKERYPTYALFEGMLVDMLYKHGRIRLENEDVKYVGEWKTTLTITGAGRRLFLPMIYQSETPDGEEVEILSYAWYMAFLEGDTIDFDGKLLERNGKKVAGVFNPNVEKMKVIVPKK
jgi:predicted nucleotidyltransferase